MEKNQFIIMVNHSKMSSVCHTCGERQEDFARRIYFDNHVKLHESSDPCLCNSCGKTYPNLLSFNEHVKKYHSQEFPCSKCGAKFNSNSGFKRHMRIHNSLYFTCDVCSKTFSRLDSLNRHKMESCNGTSAEFKCELCNEFISSKRMLDYKMMKFVKNQDKCDLTIFNSKKMLVYK